MFLQKLELASHHVFQIVFFYSAISLILLIPSFLVTRKFPFPDKDERIYVLLLSIQQSAMLFCMAFGLKFMPVFDATSILNTAPFFCIVFVSIFWRESFDCLCIILMLVILTGVCLIAFADFEVISLDKSNPIEKVYGSALVFGAAFFFGTATCTCLKLQETDYRLPVWITSCILFLISLIIGSGMQVIEFTISGRVFSGFLLIAVLNMSMLSFQASNTKFDNWLLKAVSFCTSILISLILQTSYQHIFPNSFETAGTVLIVVSIILLWCRKHLLKMFCCKACVDEEENSSLLCED